MELTERAAIETVLREARVIAVVGIHDDLAKPAGYVPEYLRDSGYRIIGVNPHKVGMTLCGEPVRATLAEIDEPIDIVDVFRRSADVPAHQDDILAMEPAPKLVWLQLGIRNDDFAAVMLEHGIDTVQNRCTLADHRAFAIPKRR